jgi:hypothetical protein
MCTPTLTWRELRAAYPDHEIQILQRLGIDQSGRALVADGKVGPRTEGAIYLNPSAVVTPVAKVALAELMRGAGESLGNNRGPDISKYMDDDNPSAQQGPWCAGFATWALRQVYPSAPRSLNARRSVSQLRHKVIQRLIRPDDLIAWEREVDGKISDVHGHVEIVALVVGDTVWTIGGNVDVRPGAAGDGVAARSYSLAAGLVNRSGNRCVGIGRHVQLAPVPPQIVVGPLAFTLAQASEALAIPVVNLTATQAVMGLAGLGAALAVLVEVIKQLLPVHVKAGHAWAKVLPVLAPLLGALLAPLLAAGWSVEGVPLSLGAHALAGLVAGSMSGGLYSVVAQSLMGRDRRLGAGGTSAE